MFKSYYFFTLFFTIVLLSSCVSKKKYSASQEQLDQYRSSLADCRESLDSTQQVYTTLNRDLQDENQKSQEKIVELQDRIKDLNETKTNLLSRLADLSVLSQASAENLKKTLESLDASQKYSMQLNERMRVKDSINLALVTNLKSSLANVNDEDVQVEVRKGVVYISLSDKMLFRSGSFAINKDAKDILSKIARILKDQDHLNILVEGHTDNVPIHTESIQDNWDLSVLRATSVVRTLEKDFDVDPARMTAGGRSEFIPKASNDTSEGKSMNRRTEIILLPDLDQFFSLISDSVSDNN